MKWTTPVLAAFTVGFLVGLVYQVLFFLLMFLVFLGVTINFSRLSVKMTSRFIIVGYGVFQHAIPWKDVEDCYLDEASAIRYGGWGIRIGRFKGKWRLVYNVIGSPRVVLLLKEGRFREFVFSTKKPEEVIKAGRQQIGRTK